MITRPQLILVAATISAAERTHRDSVNSLENTKGVRDSAAEMAHHLERQQACAAMLRRIEREIDSGGPLVPVQSGYVYDALLNQHNMLMRVMQTCEPSELAELTERAAAIALAMVTFGNVQEAHNSFAPRVPARARTADHGGADLVNKQAVGSEPKP